MSKLDAAVENLLSLGSGLAPLAEDDEVAGQFEYLKRNDESAANYFERMQQYITSLVKANTAGVFNELLAPLFVDGKEPTETEQQSFLKEAEGWCNDPVNALKFVAPATLGTKLHSNAEWLAANCDNAALPRDLVLGRVIEFATAIPFLMMMTNQEGKANVFDWAATLLSRRWV